MNESMQETKQKSIVKRYQAANFAQFMKEQTGALLLEKHHKHYSDVAANAANRGEEKDGVAQRSLADRFSVTSRDLSMRRQKSSSKSTGGSGGNGSNEQVKILHHQLFRAFKKSHKNDPMKRALEARANLKKKQAAETVGGSSDYNGDDSNKTPEMLDVEKMEREMKALEENGGVDNIAEEQNIDKQLGNQLKAKLISFSGSTKKLTNEITIKSVDSSGEEKSDKKEMLRQSTLDVLLRREPIVISANEIEIKKDHRETTAVDTGTTSNTSNTSITSIIDTVETKQTDQRETTDTTTSITDTRPGNKTERQKCVAFLNNL